MLSIVTLAEIEFGLCDKKGNPRSVGDLRAWLDRALGVFADRILPFGEEDARI